MNILKRKTEASAEPKQFDPNGLKVSTAELSDLIISELEAVDSALRYSLTGTEVSQLDPDKAEKELPNGGVFFGYGPDPKSVVSLAYIDPVFSTFISDASFAPADIVAMPAKAKTASPSKLTLLLLSDIECAIHSRFLHWAQGSRWSDFVTCKSKDLSFAAFHFNDMCGKTLRLSLKFRAESTTAEKSGKGKSSALDMSVELILPKELLESILSQYEANHSAQGATATEEIDMPIEDIQDHWAQRINHSHTRLKLVLEDLKMTVAECTRLTVGDVLPLPSVSLKELKVEAEFKDKQMCIAQATLGIHKTNRAARIIGELDPDFLDGLDVINGVAG